MDGASASWQNSLSLGMAYSITQFSAYLPRLVGAIMVFVVGLLVARVVRRLFTRAVEGLKLSKLVEKTPLELFLTNAEAGQKLEDWVGNIFYWLFLFVVLHTSVSLLGLTPLSVILGKILDYIPHVFTALFIFVAGVVLAGVVESVVKVALKPLDKHTARLFAKAASYMVVTIASLAAIAELGIASQFILILFAGSVFAFSLGIGLAVGLGGQDIVRKVLGEWYGRYRE